MNSDGVIIPIRRHRLALATGVISLLSGLGVGFYLHRPAQVVRIVLKPYMVRSKFEPVKQPQDACHGAPVYIRAMSVSMSQTENDKSKSRVYTWLGVQPAGDQFITLCYIGGDASNLMSVGDLVRLPQGKVYDEDEG